MQGNSREDQVVRMHAESCVQVLDQITKERILGPNNVSEDGHLLLDQPLDQPLPGLQELYISHSFRTPRIVDLSLPTEKP